ncbi:MAG: hypothetical protein ACR2M1_00920 [Gemmatimonadaceae bacterium]
MIRISAVTAAALGTAEKFAVNVLVDLSRLAQVDSPEIDAVELRAIDRPADGDLRACVDAGWYIESHDGVVDIPRAALRQVTAVVGAIAEQSSTAEDRFGRVPPTVNAVVAAGLERQPVISQAAVLLRQAVTRAAGSRPLRLVQPWPNGKRWAAAFTHDLDVVALWPAFTALRVVELARNRDARRIGAVVSAAVRAIGRNPVLGAVDSVLEAERAHGVLSTWFILCGSPTANSFVAGDVTYRPESVGARAILRRIAGGRNAIGLHGSFATSEGPAVFRDQRARLSALTGQPALGVRQHFLRMRPGATQAAMCAAGFVYDSTFGFADRNGFRLGVADAVPAWEETGKDALPLQLIPFCWMDRALSKYRGVEDPAEWLADAMAMADEARAVDGLWVGIWHPNMAPALGFPGATEAFSELVHRLTALDPYVATLDTIAAWRSARRAVRVRRVDADGRVVAECDADPGLPMALEHADGSAAEPVTMVTTARHVAAPVVPPAPGAHATT